MRVKDILLQLKKFPKKKEAVLKALTKEKAQPKPQAQSSIAPEATGE